MISDYDKRYNRISKSNQIFKKYNLGENDYINKFVSNYLPSSFEKLFINEFKNIKNFKEKIDVSFISSLSFGELKTIYTLYKLCAIYYLFNIQHILHIFNYI